MYEKKNNEQEYDFTDSEKEKQENIENEVKPRLQKVNSFFLDSSESISNSSVSLNTYLRDVHTETTKDRTNSALLKQSSINCEFSSSSSENNLYVKKDSPKETLTVSSMNNLSTPNLINGDSKKKHYRGNDYCMRDSSNENRNSRRSNGPITDYQEHKKQQPVEQKARNVLVTPSNLSAKEEKKVLIHNTQMLALRYPEFKDIHLYEHRDIPADVSPVWADEAMYNSVFIHNLLNDPPKRYQLHDKIRRRTLPRVSFKTIEKDFAKSTSQVHIKYIEDISRCIKKNTINKLNGHMVNLSNELHRNK